MLGISSPFLGCKREVPWGAVKTLVGDGEIAACRPFGRGRAFDDSAEDDTETGRRKGRRRGVWGGCCGWVGAVDVAAAVVAAAAATAASWCCCWRWGRCNAACEVLMATWLLGMGAT